MMLQQRVPSDHVFFGHIHRWNTHRFAWVAAIFGSTAVTDIRRPHVCAALTAR